LALKPDGYSCDQAADGSEALQALNAKPYDLVLLDADMPRMSGQEVLRRLRTESPDPHTKVLFCSGRLAGDDMSALLSEGADDYVTKPFSLVQIRARVKAVLRQKEAEDRSDHLTRYLLAINVRQEQHLAARDSQLVHARNALVLGLAKLVE